MKPINRLCIKSFMEEMRPLYEWRHRTRGTIALPIRFLCQITWYLNDRKTIKYHSRILANPDARNNHTNVYHQKFSHSSVCAKRDLLFYFISLNSWASNGVWHEPFPLPQEEKFIQCGHLNIFYQFSKRLPGIESFCQNNNRF